MSIKRVEDEINRFLSTKEPEVIAIVGSWGVGKTFAWNRFLRDASATSSIALKRYSYVSLFGINSLDDMKYAIFENAVKSSDIGIALSLEAIQANLSTAVEIGARKSLKLIKETPLLKNYVGGIAPVWYSSVQNMLVCIDDIERCGDDLSVRDVLGLVNNLKDAKACKVCMILNEEGLAEHIDDYRMYLEKVVDATLKFQPSAAECVRIALSDKTTNEKLLGEFCTKLGISNIRVIKKVERCIRQVAPLLKDHSPDIMRQAIHSITLFGWSVHEPSIAPSLEFIRKRRIGDLFSSEKTEPGPQDAAWLALLNAYEFASFDEFDAALLSGVRDGFFDNNLVTSLAVTIEKKIKAGNLDAAFQESWNKYHESFDNDADEVLNVMYESFLKAAQYITPMNLSNTMSLFKALGQHDRALKILEHYVSTRRNEVEIFDLAHSPFGEYVTDPDVVKVFAEKHASFAQTKADPANILLRIADTNSWNPDDIKTLATLSDEDYLLMFKSRRGSDLRKVIKACLRFGQLGGEYAPISEKAKVALEAIAKQSPINTLRVKGFGVNIDSPSKGSC